MEHSPLPENSPAGLKRVIDELISGREFTNQLREMIKKPVGDHDGSMWVHHEDLVGKIMGSFCQTLSILSSGEFDEISDHVPVAGSPEASSGSCKTTTSFKDRRGCYKRRKTSETIIKETSTLVDDGHAWRKYGQKQILNSTHPRNYYRCTHKFDQGCQATKHVQRTQDNPPMFRTSYHGHHTCKCVTKDSPIILDFPTDEDSSSVLLSFDSYVPTIKHEIRFQNHPSSQNFVPAADDRLSAASRGGHVALAVAALSSGSSDHGDVMSSGGIYDSSCITTTTHSNFMDMDMDMMVGSVDFEDLPFDF